MVKQTKPTIIANPPSDLDEDLRREFGGDYNEAQRRLSLYIKGKISEAVKGLSASQETYIRNTGEGFKRRISSTTSMLPAAARKQNRRWELDEQRKRRKRGT